MGYDSEIGNQNKSYHVYGNSTGKRTKVRSGRVLKFLKGFTGVGFDVPRQGSFLGRSNVIPTGGFL